MKYAFDVFQQSDDRSQIFTECLFGFDIWNKVYINDLSFPNANSLWLWILGFLHDSLILFPAIFD